MTMKSSQKKTTLASVAIMSYSSSVVKTKTLALSSILYEPLGENVNHIKPLQGEQRPAAAVRVMIATLWNE